MPLNFNRAPGPGETRDCTDPWTLIFLRANGDVALCCQSRAIGNTGQTPLPDLLEGPAALGMRKQLLTGSLAHDCLHCAERGTTTPALLRERVRHMLIEAPLEELADLRRQIREHGAVRADLLRERDSLIRHAANLQALLDDTRRHAANLESERPHLQGHIANLERELGELRERIAAAPPGS